MKKSEIIEYLLEDYKRLEDILYSLGEIKEFVQEPETLNRYIQDQFSDALMLLNAGKLDDLKEHLEIMEKKQWISSKS